MPTITSDINHSLNGAFGYRESPSDLNDPAYGEYTRALRKAFSPPDPHISRSAPESYLKIGAFVYCDTPRGILYKSFNPSRGETFQIAQIKNDKQPFLYKLKDLLGKHITGSFYSEQLREAPDPYGDFSQPIEKIISTTGKGKDKKHLVKWMFYGPKHNSYIKHSDLIE